MMVKRLRTTLFHIKPQYLRVHMIPRRSSCLLNLAGYLTTVLIVHGRSFILVNPGFPLLLMSVLTVAIATIISVPEDSASQLVN